MINTSHGGFFFTATLIMCAACLYASELVRADADNAVQLAVGAPRHLTLERDLKTGRIEVLSRADCAAERTAPNEISNRATCDSIGAEKAIGASAGNLDEERAGAVAASLGSATSR